MSFFLSYKEIAKDITAKTDILFKAIQEVVPCWYIHCKGLEHWFWKIGSRKRSFKVFIACLFKLG